MKTALLLTGNPRFSKDFDSQIHNLKNSEIDWYICFWKREEGFDPKISKNWHVKNSWQVLEKIKPFLPPGHRIKYIELLDPNDYSVLPYDYQDYYSNPINIWQQYKILQYCDRWRRELDSYDLVIRSRTDLGLSENIDLKLAYSCLSKDSKVIYTPNNQRNGYIANVGGYQTGFCDQFAIGLPHIISAYCDSIDKFHELYMSGTKYNPEYLLQTALMNEGITWPPTSFEIIRENIHWQPIDHGKWANV
jgi:hypothetical protein